MKKHSILIEISGWSGMATLIIAYALNSFGLIPSQGFWYSFLNLVSAVFLGIRVYADRNYANTVLEIFWGGVAIIALLNILI